jgi:hypothetical protein
LRSRDPRPRFSAHATALARAALAATARTASAAGALARPTRTLRRGNPRASCGTHGAPPPATTAASTANTPTCPTTQKTGQLLFEGFDLFLKRDSSPKLFR